MSRGRRVWPRVRGWLREAFAGGAPSGPPYSRHDLRRAIKKLPEDEPEESDRVWYRSQKEHWLGWLDDYDGPGAYGRKHWDRDARFVYNHVVCPDMLLYLADAAGVGDERVEAAIRACEEIEDGYLQQQAAAIRRVIPWEVVEKALWGDASERSGGGQR